MDTDTASDITAKENCKEYPPIRGVLVCDPHGLVANNAIGVHVNVAPSAHRGRPNLPCIVVTINGLGLIALSVDQVNRLIPSLANARHEAELAFALSNDA